MVVVAGKKESTEGWKTLFYSGYALFQTRHRLFIFFFPFWSLDLHSCPVVQLPQLRKLIPCAQFSLPVSSQCLDLEGYRGLRSPSLRLISLLYGALTCFCQHICFKNASDLEGLWRGAGIALAIGMSLSGGCVLLLCLQKEASILEVLDQILRALF